MGCTKAKRRRQEKISTVAGQVPTVPTVADHCTSGWLVTDIYKGEIFINVADRKVYSRDNTGVFLLGRVQTVTGNIVDNTDPLNPVVNESRRVLNVNTTHVGTPASTDPTVLASYTMPALTMDADDDFIEINFTITANVDPATLEFYFGGTQVMVVNGILGVYSGNITIIRDDATSQHNIIFASELAPSGTIAVSYSDTCSEDLSQIVVIQIIGTNAGATANALMFEAWTITKN